MEICVLCDEPVCICDGGKGDWSLEDDLPDPAAFNEDDPDDDYNVDDPELEEDNSGGFGDDFI